MSKAAGLAVAALIALAAGCDSSSARQEAACRDGGSAYLAAQALVVDRLVSPATAVFPSIGERGVQVEKPHGCRQLIASYVDSQNVFGAVVRSEFIAIMELSPEGEWEAGGFNLSETPRSGAVKRD